MRPVGVFRVVGPNAYLGRAVGSLFAGALDKRAIQRALERGNVELVETVGGGLPDRYALPKGWTA